MLAGCECIRIFRPGFNTTRIKRTRSLSSTTLPSLGSTLTMSCALTPGIARAEKKTVFTVTNLDLSMVDLLADREILCFFYTSASDTCQMNLSYRGVTKSSCETMPFLTIQI